MLPLHRQILLAMKQLVFMPMQPLLLLTLLVFMPTQLFFKQTHQVQLLTQLLSYANGAFAQANTDVTNISITSATYGNAAYYPIITVSANGRINTVTTQVVTGVDAHPFLFTAMGS
jgi:hypothetical protein